MSVHSIFEDYLYLKILFRNSSVFKDGIKNAQVCQKLHLYSANRKPQVNIRKPVLTLTFSNYGLNFLHCSHPFAS